jgi:cell division protein FtsQ
VNGRAAPLVIGEYRGSRGRRLAVRRRPRRSWRQTSLRAGAAAALLGLLAGGGYWLLTAPMFEITRIESGPYRYSSEQEVAAALSGFLRHNIWTLSSRRVAAASAGLPWVREIRVKRRIPDTLNLALLEWQPLLAVADAGGGDGHRLLVGDGRILALPDDKTPPILPVLVGCSLAPDGPGQWRLAEHDPAQVIAVMEAVILTGLESICPVDFVRASDAGFVVVLQGRAGSLLLGDEDYRSRLARYLLARSRIPPGAQVDLRFSDRVTFVPPGPGRG